MWLTSLPLISGLILLTFNAWCIFLVVHPGLEAYISHINVPFSILCTYEYYPQSWIRESFFYKSFNDFPVIKIWNGMLQTFKLDINHVLCTSHFRSTKKNSSITWDIQYGSLNDTSKQKLPFLLQWTNFPEGFLAKSFSTSSKMWIST